MEARFLHLLAFLLILFGTVSSKQGTVGILSHVPEKIEHEIHEYAAIYSSFPPPFNNESKVLGNREIEAGCDCKQILVSSLGDSITYQHDSLGIYNYYQLYNNHPSYFGPGNRRLYFLFNSGWLIGPTLGNPSGYIHNSNQYQCPYLVPKGWMFVNSGYWYIDDTLVVRCIA